MLRLGEEKRGNINDFFSSSLFFLLCLALEPQAVPALTRDTRSWCDPTADSNCIWKLQNAQDDPITVLTSNENEVKPPSNEMKCFTTESLGILKNLGRESLCFKSQLYSSHFMFGLFCLNSADWPVFHAFQW